MALPLKKRKISAMSVSSNAQKIKTLEKVVYRRNFGEVKTLTSHQVNLQIVNGGFHSQILTGIATGPNQGQRVGNELRIRDILITGWAGTEAMNVFLIQSKTGTAPVAGNFTPVNGSQLTQGTAQNHFRILQRGTLPSNSNPNLYMKKTWSIPMKVNYTGPTDTELSSNQIYVVFLNYTGSNQTIAFTSTINYID